MLTSSSINSRYEVATRFLRVKLRADATAPLVITQKDLPTVNGHLHVGNCIARVVGGRSSSDGILQMRGSQSSIVSQVPFTAFIDFASLASTFPRSTTTALLVNTMQTQEELSLRFFQTTQELLRVVNIPPSEVHLMASTKVFSADLNYSNWQAHPSLEAVIEFDLATDQQYLFVPTDSVWDLAIQTLKTSQPSQGVWRFQLPGSALFDSQGERPFPPDKYLSSVADVVLDVKNPVSREIVPTIPSSRAPCSWTGYEILRDSCVAPESNNLYSLLFARTKTQLILDLFSGDVHMPLREILAGPYRPAAYAASVDLLLEFTYSATETEAGYNQGGL
jgi:hypothetical protein